MPSIGGPAGAIDERPVAASSDPKLAVEERAVSAHVGAASRLNAAIVKTQAKAALTSLGWKSAIAGSAVATAAAALGSDISLEQLIFESLRRCPAPRA